MTKRLLILSGLIGIVGLSSMSQALAESMEYGTGALPPKTRQAVVMPQATTQSSSQSAPPASFDLSQWAVAPGNQGNVNSCVGWTIGHDMAGWYANWRKKSVVLFAPMYVYSQIDPGRDQGVDAGAYAVDALNLAIDQGIDTAQDYSQGDFDYMDLPTKAERSNAARYKRQLFKGYEVLFANENGGGGPDLTAALKLAISQYRPVAIGMVLRPGFRNLSRSNTIDRDTTGALSGGHEVLAVGYNSDGLIVENHWGPKWGSNGYGVVAWNVVEHDVLEAVIAD